MKQWADRPVIKTYLVIDFKAKDYKIEDFDSHTDEFMEILQAQSVFGLWEVPPVTKKEDFEPVEGNIFAIMGNSGECAANRRQPLSSRGSDAELNCAVLEEHIEILWRDFEKAD